MNIVLIFADQMHKYALGKISGYVRTPNLDRLSEAGVLFQNAYSNNPVCTPFRGVLFTGMYSSRSGVVGNNDPLPGGTVTMADAFNKAGYETSFVGKWHLGGAGNGPIPQHLRGGFRHFIGYQCYNGFYNNVHFYDEENRELKFQEHREDVATKLAVDRLKLLHGTGRPFLHVVAYQAPHYPVQPSPEFEGLYKDKDIPYAPDYEETDPYTPTFSPYSPRPFDRCPDFQRYGGNMQAYMRLYYGMVSQIDAGVGRILDCLEELGIREDTAVIFTSDHGDMQGSHGMLNKCLPYEKSCGIPLVISAPGGVKNRECTVPVSCLDLYPTCLDYAGIPLYGHLQGESIARATAGEALDGHQPVLAENFNHYLKLDGSEEKGCNWKMIRKGRYKLTVNWDTKEPCLLYDMEADPYEMNNLVHSGEYQQTVGELAEMICRLLPE